MDLWDALERGDVDDVKDALQAGANPNARASNGYRALDVATEMADAADDVDVMTALLDAGARVQDVNAEGLTPLFFALQHDHPQVAALLLARGANVNTRQATSGLTPLMVAVKHGSTQVVELLLDSGADIHAQALPQCTAQLRDEWDSQLQLLQAMFEDVQDAYGQQQIRLHEGLMKCVTQDLVVTAALMAAAFGHAALLERLTSRGAVLDDAGKALLALYPPSRA